MATVKQTKTITGSTSSSTWTWKQVITESWADDYLDTNESIVKVETYMGRASGSSTASFGGTATTKITCDGVLRSKSQNWVYQSFWISGGGWKLIQTEEFPVEHEDDGTKKITVSSSLSTSDFNPNSASASGEITLTTIPRATECPNLDGYIESGAVIALNTASKTFKHRLYYSYGKKTGWYPSSTTFFTDSGTLPLDTSFYAETPKSSGTGGITLYTYTSDGTQIGSSSGTLTVRCDETKCKPTISATIIDINSNTTTLTDSNTKLVKGFSTAQITYIITPKNSASISSKKVNGLPLNTSPHKISNVSTNTFKIEVVDSRGFPATETYTNNMVNYIPLTLTFEAFRPSPTGSEIKVNYQGNYFNGSFGNKTNALLITWKWRLKGSSTWNTGGTFQTNTDYKISGNSYKSNGDISLGNIFPYENNYEIGIDCIDRLVDASTYKTVPKGKPVIYWEDNLAGVNGDFVVNEEVISDGLKVSVTEPAKGEKVWLQKSKNLFNINGNVNLYCNNGVQVSGGNIVSGNVLTATQNTYYAHNVGQKFTNLKGKTFTFSAKVVSVGTGSVGHIAIYEDGVDVKHTSISVGSIGQVTYTGKSDNIILGFATGSGENAQFTDIQVELGDTATSYEPYIESEKIYIKNDNGIYEEFVAKNQKNILHAYLGSSDVNLTTDSSQSARIPLNMYEAVGDKLTFNSAGNGIVIGKGVSKVSVKASICYLQTATQANRAICIYKNNSRIAQKIESLYNVRREFGNVDIEIPILSVSEGDVIRLLIRTVAQTNIDLTVYYGKESTNLTIEVLE